MNKPAQIEVPPTGLALLRVPFAPHQISQLPKGNTTLDYVGHAALTDRLLDADPSWNWEPLAFTPEGLPQFDAQRGLWIKLTICGQTRLGYGHAGTKQGGDAVKEVIGDALRNAAMRFGAALDLWHKGDLHLEDASEARGGHSQEDAVNPPVAKPAPWREPDSDLSTPTKLHREMARLERDLAGCGDSDMVYALTASAEWREFARIAEKHAPHYLHGGDPAPEEFEGLANTAARLVREFDAATANHMTDLAHT